MSAELLALYDTDKAAFILAVADLRERRTVRLAGTYPAPWRAGETSMPDVMCAMDDAPIVVEVDPDWNDADLLAEHIAAEANPDHALAAVRRWRGVVDRHKPSRFNSDGDPYWYSGCTLCLGYPHWPCPDVRETADEARAYAGGAP